MRTFNVGTFPETPAYPEGAECAVCVSALFGGVTPKYVEAHVDGVIDCPGGPVFDPNGVVLLTQNAACGWLGGKGGFAYNWILLVGQSIFRIESGLQTFFTAAPLIECVTEFTNLHTACTGGVVLGKDGTVEIFWGPTIGP